jgi:hypothetical protein
VEGETMAAKLVYEKVNCSRCGGSGHYSSCSMYGTTCFKCAGRKVTLSPAAAKSAAIIKDFMAANFSVKAKDLKAGDRIKYDGRVVTLKDVVIDGDSRYGYKDPVSGEMVWKPYTTITFDSPLKSGLGPVTSAGVFPDSWFVKAISGADWDKVVAFVKDFKLKGVTIEETVNA